ncbi:MAG: serine/threonine-protein kinase [Polyangiaceae bacterium]
MAIDPGASLLNKLLDGRYRLERELGEGGSGRVFAATHIALESQVAVKVLNLPANLSVEQHARRLDDFLEEARTLTRLRHPNIVTAIDLGVVEVDGVLRPYFVMELCQGLSLRDFIEDHGGVGLAVAWQLVEPLVRAVAHAHRLGVVHRDIKPGNVMLDTHPEDGSWVPKLIDFGVAKAIQVDVEPGTGRTQTTSGASPYTPAYAAPEQVVGGRTGPWTDVHALGLLFIELVTGMPAYDGEDPRMRVIDGNRPSASAHGVDVGAFAPVLERAVSLKPQDRYRDAGELLTALLACAVDAGLAAETKPRARVHSAAFQDTLDLRSGETAEPRVLGDTETEQPISRDAVSLGQSTELATRAAPSPAKETSRKTWWIGALGAVAVSGLGLALGLGAFSKPEVAAEPPASAGAPTSLSVSTEGASVEAPASSSAAASVSAAPSASPSTSTALTAKRPANPLPATSVRAKPQPPEQAKPPTLY